jgi:hypothetical protein
MVYVPGHGKFGYAQMYITGRADNWLWNSGVLDENLNWTQLCEVLLKIFTESNSFVLEEFYSIKQGVNSVNEYTVKFEDSMSNYRKENLEVKEPYYIECYTNGLLSEIKHYMKPLQPSNLYDDVQYTRDMEKAVLATTQSQQKRYASSHTYTRNTNLFRILLDLNQLLKIIPLRKILIKHRQNLCPNTMSRVLTSVVGRNGFLATVANSTKLSTSSQQKPMNNQTNKLLQNIRSKKNLFHHPLALLLTTSLCTSQFRQCRVRDPSHH